MIRGTRRVFTLPKFGTPELIVVAGEKPPSDTFTKRLVGKFIADAADAMAKVSGLLLITKDYVKDNLFTVSVYTPDYMPLGVGKNPVGTNDIDVTVDPFAVAIWLFGQGFTGKDTEHEDIQKVLTWLDDTLVKAIAAYAPDESRDFAAKEAEKTVAAAKAAQEFTPDAENFNALDCKGCPEYEYCAAVSGAKKAN
jgi:hypothetical protein